MDKLTDWCRIGQTVALVGSSGVGKSTLAMSLGIRHSQLKGFGKMILRGDTRRPLGGFTDLTQADC